MYKKFTDIPNEVVYAIDWEMTPEEAIALHLEWGPLRSQSMYNSRDKDNETIYFCVNTWDEKKQLHLIKRKGFDVYELGKFDFPKEFKDDFQNTYKGVFEPTEELKNWIMKKLDF